MTFRHPQRLAIALAIALVVGPIAATWLLSGVAIDEAARFVVFEALYVVLPGCLLYLTLIPNPGGRLRIFAIGWPLGYAIEVGAFALTAALHMRDAFTFLPLVSVALIAWLLTRTRGREYLHAIRMKPGHRGSAQRLSPTQIESVLVAAVIGVAFVLLAFTLFILFPLPDYIRSVSYFPDSVFDISLAAEARNHWPITSPWIAGLPLRYYTAVFIHGAAINQVTGVALATVYFRLLPSAITLLVALQLCSLGRSMGRPRSAGVFAVVIFFVMEAATLNPTRSWPFEGDSLRWISEVPTFGFGVVFLLALLSLVQHWLGAGRPEAPHSNRRRAGPLPRGSSGILVVTGMLVLACGASKTFAAADFIGGLGLYWLWSLATGRASRLLLYSLVVSIVCFGVVYFVMLAGGDADTQVIHLFNFLSRESLLVHIREQAQSLVGHSILWVLFLVGVASILIILLSAPVLGLAWLLLQRSALSSFEIFCLAVFLAGLAGYAAIGGPVSTGGDSVAAEFYFRYIGYFAIVPVAAGGWAELWSNTPKDARRTMASACGGVLLLGMVIAGGSRLIALTQRTEHPWYLAMYGLVGVVVILLAMRLSGHYTSVISSRGGRVLACCIPMVGVLGLLRPAAYTAVKVKATILHEMTAPRDSPSAYGMTAALYRGLIWVRTHTRVCDVLAVNNHTGTRLGPPSPYVYYSAFAERRVFMENWIYTPSGVLGRQPFPKRLALNDSAVIRGNPIALKELAREGVSYVLVDRAHGSGAPEPPSVSRLVFSNSALDVYRLVGGVGAGHHRLGCDAEA